MNSRELRQFFQSIYIEPTDQWLAELSAFLASIPGQAREAQLDLAYKNFLRQDMAETSLPALPRFNSNSNTVHRKPMVLQVNACDNIGVSPADTDQERNRVIRLELTDGHNAVVAYEFNRTALPTAITPGAKALLLRLTVERGAVVLEGDQILVLGGVVERLATHYVRTHARRLVAQQQEAVIRETKRIIQQDHVTHPRLDLDTAPKPQVFVPSFTPSVDVVKWIGSSRSGASMVPRPVELTLLEALPPFVFHGDGFTCFAGVRAAGSPPTVARLASPVVAQLMELTPADYRTNRAMAEQGNAAAHNTLLGAFRRLMAGLDDVAVSALAVPDPACGEGMRGDATMAVVEVFVESNSIGS
ncbi:hypothetical protein J8273_8158 [Carpediemonas membranifera]|uniref:RecQ-mediated genome instability protein 1 n=1 Tax=Carpediemonas membranifera TaxID=201153 RepID=A0A8J6AS56_9EUKA|nr:hypothetical protein J8273_8158 [Carpediemonas membranifera]|eukprot:KAG9390120.1 hypothetical protein J8273_8158 [Carpediemonas membranifera]